MSTFKKKAFVPLVFLPESPELRRWSLVLDLVWPLGLFQSWLAGVVWSLSSVDPTASRVRAESAKLSADARQVNWLPLTELIKANEVKEQLEADEQADEDDEDEEAVEAEHDVAVELIDLGRSSYSRRLLFA